jgi:malate synthase
MAALEALAEYNRDVKAVMAARIEKRARRFRKGEYITFLNPGDTIAGTDISVRDARRGKFVGAEIPEDLKRQWIQGTGPGAKPNAPVASSIRNVAYALLSGADGWMFDGEDALGQVSAMSLDNQRNLKLAVHKQPIFLKVAEQVAKEMSQWALGFHKREIISDWDSRRRSSVPEGCIWTTGTFEIMTGGRLRPRSSI